MEPEDVDIVKTMLRMLEKETKDPKKTIEALLEVFLNDSAAPEELAEKIASMKDDKGIIEQLKILKSNGENFLKIYKLVTQFYEDNKYVFEDYMTYLKNIKD